MPALSRHFGLHPPVVEELTPEELEPYLLALKEMAKQARRAERERAGRRR
jgi:hypothetical protein